jgi:hypothetical protein
MGGNQGATLQVIEAAGVTLLSPPSSTAGLKSIVVTTAGGSTTLVNSFTYVALPAINTNGTGIDPTAGITAGSTTVTIRGTNLSNPQFVLFGITAGTGLISNAVGETLIALSPAYLGSQASLPAIVSISVRTAGGTGTLENAYTYVGPMSITSVTPNRGPTGGG